MDFTIGSLPGTTGAPRQNIEERDHEVRLLATGILPLSTKVFEADQSPCTSDPSKDCLERISEGFTVKIRKGTKRTTLFRFLLAKMVYDCEEGLHLDEFLTLWSLGQDLSMELTKEGKFKEKWEFFLGRSLQFLKNVPSKEFPIRLSLSQEQREKLLKYFGENFPQPQAYFGLRGNRLLRSSFTLKLNSQLPSPKIPPKRFVGVGYKDHGLRRNFAKDGSPSWQEVNLIVSNLERLVEEGLLDWEEIPEKLKVLLNGGDS